MRRLLPLLLAALAACQVDVEGAPCRLGYADDCPSGQSCGLDLRCSKSACTCQGGLVCGMASGTPGCVCPPNDGPEFAADPRGSTLGAAPYPTGVESPVECRFGRLGDALAAAAVHAAAHPETGAVARAYGEAPATFGVAETGESFPLEIAPAVVLRTDGARVLDPASWLIRADTADTSSPTDIITLYDGADIVGFTVASVSAAGDVVRLSCGSRTKATLSHVVVDGGGVAAHGVNVSGACDVEATELTITRAKGAGLFVSVDRASDTEPITGVQIFSGAISDNGGNGAEVRGGRLGLFGDASRPLAVAQNGGFGVLAKPRDEFPVPIALEVQFADVFGNGETGLVVRNLPSKSSASVRSTDIHENKASTALSETVTGRYAGGALIYGTPAVPLSLVGTRFFSNRHDQLTVISSDTWTLSGSNCGGEANVFACHDAERGGKLIYASGAQQTFAFTQWSPLPPDSLLVGVATVVPCPEHPRVPAVCPAIP